LETVFECLKCGLNLIGWPFLLPLTIADTKAVYTQQILQKCQTNINQFASTGTYVDDPSAGRGGIEPAAFDENISLLTWTAGLLAWCEWTANVYHDILEFIEAAAKSDVQVVYSSPEGRVILLKLSSLKQFMNGNKWRTSYLQERRNGYILTVSTVM